MLESTAIGFSTHRLIAWLIEQPWRVLTWLFYGNEDPAEFRCALTKAFALVLLAATVSIGSLRAIAQSDKPLGAASALNDPAWKAQIGVAGSIGHPDYTRYKTGAVMVYGTYNFLPNMGLDVRGHYLFESHGVKEATFSAGPRFTLPLKRLDPYISGMVGYGHFTYNANNALVYGNDSFIITYASGLDLRATRHLNVRLVDLEYQRWVNFLPNGLTPTIYSAGISYHR